MIISVSGYAASGKDTIGKLIQLIHCYNTGSTTTQELLDDYVSHQWWMEDQSGWEIKKWAGKLKTIASLLTGIPQEKFEDQKFKTTALGREWCYPTEWQGREHWVEMTVREFLQRLGTEGLRTGLHENTWVNALMADYKLIDYNDDEQPELPNWIITDTRFPNEAQAIKNAGGITIRVNRPGYEPINAHPSETALDHWNFDYTITNDGDISKLYENVLQILREQGLLKTDKHADHQTKN